MKLKDIAKDLVGLKESIGYKAFWLTPEGEHREFNTHFEGAIKILGNKYSEFGFEAQMEKLYNDLYQQGYVRYALERDRILVSPILSVIPHVPKRNLRDLGLEKNLPIFDDTGALLREWKKK